MFRFNEIKEYGQPYIIAEIGSNHNGDMELAKKLIDAAKASGADCVKFQSWSKDTIFSKKVYADNYFLRDDYRNRTDYTLEEIVDEYSIDRADHYLLKEYCDSIGIEFNSTPFSKGEVDLLVDELKVPFIKIASMDLNNIPFLTYVAKKGRPVVISTGLCGLADVSDAVQCLRENGCEEIILLHCVSIYPPESRMVNLNNIDMLRQTFGCKVGYSDHTLGTLAPILAMGKGACIIEKHFTIDKNMKGWDHKISADPAELSVICEAAGTAYQMLGSYQKVVNEDQERRDAFKRSIVAATDIKAGEVFSDKNLDFKRPGTGIEPKYYDLLVGRAAKHDISRDSLISLDDF
ncbi:MAG: N-acetylneuraminate synthase [Lachnospiraceae bacterium]|nr:N-acetylneuraminate synthase [Lachnospiraceae bacterium]